MDLYQRETLKINVNGVDLEYEKAGYGPEPLIFAHGAGGTGTAYHVLLSRLPLSRVTIYAPTSRGCGNSGRPESGYTSPELADEVVAFADALALGKFHISGHSLGGLIAMNIAARFPARVISAMLIEPAPALGYKPDMLALTAGMCDVFIEGNQDVIGLSVRSMIGWYVDDLGVKSTCENFTKVGADYWRGLLATNGSRKVGEPPELQDRLKDITSPCILITADHDVLLFPYNLEDFKSIPGCELQVFAAQNHFLPFEDPDGVAQVMTKFMDRVARRRLRSVAQAAAKS